MADIDVELVGMNLGLWATIECYAFLGLIDYCYSFLNLFLKCSLE